MQRADPWGRSLGQLRVSLELVNINSNKMQLFYNHQLEQKATHPHHPQHQQQPEAKLDNVYLLSSAKEKKNTYIKIKFDLNFIDTLHCNISTNKWGEGEEERGKIQDDDNYLKAARCFLNNLQHTFGLRVECDAVNPCFVDSFMYLWVENKISICFYHFPLLLSITFILFLLF